LVLKERLIGIENDREGPHGWIIEAKWGQGKVKEKGRSLLLGWMS
jgi:hypothetical protein